MLHPENEGTASIRIIGSHLQFETLSCPMKHKFPQRETEREREAEVPTWQVSHSCLIVILKKKDAQRPHM